MFLKPGDEKEYIYLFPEVVGIDIPIIEFEFKVGEDRRITRMSHSVFDDHGFEIFGEIHEERNQQMEMWWPQKVSVTLDEVQSEVKNHWKSLEDQKRQRAAVEVATEDDALEDDASASCDVRSQVFGHQPAASSVSKARTTASIKRSFANSEFSEMQKLRRPT